MLGIVPVAAPRHGDRRAGLTVEETLHGIIVTAIVHPQLGSGLVRVDEGPSVEGADKVLCPRAGGVGVCVDAHQQPPDLRAVRCRQGDKIRAFPYAVLVSAMSLERAFVGPS